MSTSSEGSLDVDTNVVLRVECISRLSLNKFVFIKCILRWTALGLWAVFVALGYMNSELTNLHLATALSAIFLTSAIAILGTLVHFTVKAAKPSSTGKLHNLCFLPQFSNFW